MPNSDAILRQIIRDLAPRFEEQVCLHLAEQDQDWLVEQTTLVA